jgi:exosortase
METVITPKTPLLEELKRLLPERHVQLAWLVLTAVFVSFYWSSFHRLITIWWREEDYQHGFFVPLFAVILLWLRRDMIPQSTGRGNWWGLAFFGLWALIRWTSVYFNYMTLPEVSMIPFLLGVTIFVSGWQGLRWAWPSIVFLIFMIPLPGAVQGFASTELQKLATRWSVRVIQTLGIPAVAEGITIQLTNKPLEVAQACSGLRMMMLFFAICTAAAFLARKKPLWERLFMVGCAAPIAVISNVTRIVMTAVIFEITARCSSFISLDVERVEKIIHDWAGFLMMPVGLLLLLAVMSLVSKLMVAPPPDRPLAVGGLRGQGAPADPVVRRRQR